MHSLYMLGFSPTSWVVGRKVKTFSTKRQTKTVYSFGPFRLLVCRNLGEF